MDICYAHMIAVAMQRAAHINFVTEKYGKS